MLDPKLIRSSLTTVAAALKNRGFHLPVEDFHRYEEERKSLQVKMQTLQNERNVRSKEVGQCKAKGENVEEALKNLKILSDELSALEKNFSEKQAVFEDLLARLPNIAHTSVPIGKSEEDNTVVRVWGEPAQFDFTPKDHVELGAPHGYMDFETASKISGARFVVLRGPLAKLQRALSQFMLDLHTNENGYQEIAVPALVNANSLYGTGQLPKLKEDLFAILNQESSGQEFYLIPTSEVPVTNTIRDEIINIADLPIKYVCYSSCFRSEAGTYGKDMRGMIRQHQFEKVELVQIVHPSQSYQALEELTHHAETVLQRLELPYRIVTLCTGDMGFSSAKTYDLEVWLPGQNRYREISSCSNMEAFQARRMKARLRNETGQIEWVHTLNGSALAIGRTLVAVIENYQDKLGRIHIPTVLQPYMNGLKVIE
jgi:seryl-tRNA synthetase